MGVALHVIPCLNIRDGRVIKGINFRDLRDAGDPVELTTRYGAEGADESTFLDISASAQDRETIREMVTRCTEIVLIPLTAGGGMRSVTDADALLRCGADKASINTGAFADPEVIDKVAARFGSQVLVLSLDARRTDWVSSGLEVIIYGGRRPAGRDAIKWTKEAMDRGVGEVLLNSMDAGGTTDGFNIGMTRAARAVADVPPTASGRAGTMVHFIKAVRTGVGVMLAASVFYYGRLTIVGVRQELTRVGFKVRKV